MRIIKGKYPNGDKLYTAFPTTTKDLFRIFSVYGLHAEVCKWGGYYDIMYRNSKENGGPKFVTTGVKKIDSMTAKKWLELADKHCPEKNRGEKDILWTEYKKYVELETLA